MLKFNNISKNREILFKVFQVLPMKNIAIKFLNLMRLYKMSKIKTPENITFFITNRCNAKCKHCFYWKSLNMNIEELSIQDIRKFVSSLQNRVEILLVTGGEPLMRQDIYEIIELFYKINKTKKIHITSNGSMPEKLYFLCKKILKNMNLELSVQISIDGQEDYHNKLRGVNIYSKAIQSLKLLNTLKNKNFVLAASTVLTKFNISEIKYISKEMEKLGIHWGFQMFRDSNSIIGLDKNLILDYNPQMQGVLPEIREIRNLINIYYPKEKKELKDLLQKKIFSISLRVINGEKSPLKCTARITDAVIYPNGDVSLCEITKPFDNLKNYDFDFYRLWVSKKAEKAREKIKNCSCIHPCHMINSMKYDYRIFLDKE